MSDPILDVRHILGLTIRFDGEPVQLWPAHLRCMESAAQDAVASERAQWVTAFTAYRQALGVPIESMTREEREENMAEVQRRFDHLCKLQEGV